MPGTSQLSKPKLDPRRHIRRLSARAEEVRWVLRTLKRQSEDQAKIQNSDLRTELEAGRNRARQAMQAGVLPATSVSSSPASEKLPTASTQALKPWRRILAPANAALGHEIREQLARLRAAERNRARLQATIGDPTTFVCLFRADTVAATASPVVTQGQLNLIPSPPTTQNSVSARNRVRFVAVATSPIGYTAELAQLVVDTVHVFSFASGLGAVCTPTAFFEPNATFSLTVPNAVYYFPVWHAVPRARLFLWMDLRADHWFPGVFAGDPPSATFSTFAMRPDVSLSGWGGAKSASGTLLTGSPSSLSLPAFAILSGSRVVVTTRYQMFLQVLEGGNGVVDASSRDESGLNISVVSVRLDY